MTEFNSAGTVISNYKFRYDSKNRPVKAEGTDDTGRSNVQTSKYDSRGYEIERGLISMGRKRNETRTVLNYDKEGNLTGLKNYLNDKLNDQQNFYYKNNLRTKTVILNGDGDTAIVMIPEYNEKGKLIREVKTEGKSRAAENYRYDDKGNLIELVDSETRREYRFDDKNNVIEHKMFLLDGRRQIRLIFNYNEKGLQSEQIRYDNSEKIVYHTVFEYEYYK
jgi:antitoxin component YwqK of YwqJK toxin-antitoxin module